MAVISPQYCSPYGMEMTIVKGFGRFTVADMSGNVIFRVRRSLFNIRARHRLYNAVGMPLVTLRQKIMSIHGRWRAYMGDSSYSRDLIFNARRASVLGGKVISELNAYLPANISEHFYDFKIIGGYQSSTCTIYAGNCVTVLAQMQKRPDLGALSISGREQYVLRVSPNVDYAFIVSLLIIFFAHEEARGASLFHHHDASPFGHF
ncbi:protein LURP-one-related 15 [Malania oleifera]|uniref:protein LURP-one-related 15 n=1 Tax=Malania oleifera TaxID=397392 RepID=UPI0025ADF000|nr:protein LURP-one-related 15 [Malania oleifera]